MAQTCFLGGKTATSKNTNTATITTKFGRPLILSERVPVDVHSVLPTYDVPDNVRGPGGINLQYISDQSGAAVSLRGQGSGYLEEITGKESSEPLHILVQHHNAEVLKKARILAGELVGTVRKEYLQHYQQLILQQPASSNLVCHNHFNYVSGLCGPHFGTTSGIIMPNAQQTVMPFFPEVMTVAHPQESILRSILQHQPFEYQPQERLAEVASDVQEINKLTLVIEQQQRTIQTQSIAAANLKSNHLQLISEPRNTPAIDKLTQISQQLEHILQTQRLAAKSQQSNCLKLMPAPNITPETNHMNEIVQELQHTVETQYNPRNYQFIESDPTSAPQDELNKIVQQLEHLLMALPNSTPQVHNSSQLVQHSQPNSQVQFNSEGYIRSSVQDIRSSHTQKMDHMIEVSQELLKNLQTKYQQGDQLALSLPPTSQQQMDKMLHQLQQFLQTRATTTTSSQVNKQDMVSKVPENQSGLQIISDMHRLILAMRTLIFVLKSQSSVTQDQLSQLVQTMKTILQVFKNQPKISIKKCRKVKEFLRELPKLLMGLPNVSVTHVVQLTKHIHEIQKLLKNENEKQTITSLGKTWSHLQNQTSSESHAQISHGHVQQKKSRGLIGNNND